MQKALQRERTTARRQRAKLLNNRARGGISNAARRHIGGGTVSLAEAIIISRIQKNPRKYGQISDYTHDQIKDMALRMVGARARSIGFLAAGWLQSIKTLSKKIGQTFRANKGVKSFAKNVSKIGFCIPASGWDFRPKAFISNRANAKHDHKEALYKYGQPALQRAFDEERKDMLVYIEKELRKQAKASGIKTN